MILPDVNVLVYAHRPDAENHIAYRTWLEHPLAGDRAYGLSHFVLSSFLRIVTNRRILLDPSLREGAGLRQRDSDHHRPGLRPLHRAEIAIFAGLSEEDRDELLNAALEVGPIKGRNRFTRKESEEIKERLRNLRAADRDQQKRIRDGLRDRYRFYITDFDRSARGLDSQIKCST